MIKKSEEYIQFEEGYLKEAADNGCNVDFLRGLIKEADEMVEAWREAFDKLAAESGDPQYKFKMAQELVYFATKEAEGNEALAPTGLDFADKFRGMMQPLNGNSDFLQKNPNLLTNAAGAGVGGLLGLLVGALFNHPMIGMMLGALGVGGIMTALTHGTFAKYFNEAKTDPAAATRNLQQANAKAQQIDENPELKAHQVGLNEQGNEVSDTQNPIPGSTQPSSQPSNVGLNEQGNEAGIPTSPDPAKLKARIDADQSAIQNTNNPSTAELFGQNVNQTALGIGEGMGQGINKAVQGIEAMPANTPTKGSWSPTTATSNVGPSIGKGMSDFYHGFTGTPKPQVPPTTPPIGAHPAMNNITAGLPKPPQPMMRKISSLNLALLAEMFKEADDFSSVGGNNDYSQPQQAATANPAANNNPSAFGATSGNSASNSYSNTMQAPSMGNTMAPMAQANPGQMMLPGSSFGGMMDDQMFAKLLKPVKAAPEI